MTPKQTSPDSLHPPVIAGASTGEESRGIFHATDKPTYEFPAEYETQVFVNGNNTITIHQMTSDINDPEQMIVIGSKKRALEIARAIRHLAGLAEFHVDEEDS